jgi:hypothetical protein
MDKNILADLRLKMHIEHPDYEECYVDGYACGLAEMDEEMNPYGNDSIEGQYWTEGWWSAFYDEKPLFSLEGVNITKAQPKPHEHRFADFVVTFLEISGVLAVSTLVGYQLWELVA